MIGAAAMVASDDRAEAATARSGPHDQRPPTTRRVLFLARLTLEEEVGRPAVWGARPRAESRLYKSLQRTGEVFTRQGRSSLACVGAEAVLAAAF